MTKLADFARPENVASRFWARVEKRGPDECWHWNGSKCGAGYGKIHFRNQKRLGAHRVSYMLEHGEVPDDLQVCHTCDNRRCVNPAHLWVGTVSDNAVDMLAKGRSPHVGENHRLAKLTWEAVRFIRSSSEPARVIAAKFGVSPFAIGDVRHNRTWVSKPFVGSSPSHAWQRET